MEENERKHIYHLNIYNQLIMQMDPIEKIGCYLDHCDGKLLDYEDKLDGQVETKVRKMIDDEFKWGFHLDHNGILGLINDATKIKETNMSDFNIVYNQKLQRLYMFRSENWQPFPKDVGLTEVVRLLKSYILDVYECYLIKQIFKYETGHLNSAVEYNKQRIYVEDYYKFIGIFDLPPVIIDKTDHEILNPDSLVRGEEKFDLSERYCKIYGNVKSNIKPSEKTKMKTKVLDILKSNMTYNIGELNRQILHLLKMESNFKKKFMEILGCNG